MKSRIVIIFFSILQLFSADINALIKEKQLYKMQNHKSVKSENGIKEITIFFKKLPKDDIKKIEKLSNIEFKKCILPKICIFRAKSNIEKSIKLLKNSFKSIEKIEIAKKYKFNKY